MVNKLRKKFVITAMLSLLVILIIMIAVINIANISQCVRDADNLLQILTTNNGFFPGMLKDNNNQQPPRPDRPLGFEHLNNMRSMEMPYQTRYFWVRFDSSGMPTRVGETRPLSRAPSPRPCSPRRVPCPCRLGRPVSALDHVAVFACARGRRLSGAWSPCAAAAHPPAL